MAARHSWVNEIRAEALAALYLTRHEELDVLPVSRYVRSPRYDLLVRINVPDAARTPEFAVDAKGARDPIGKGTWATVLRGALEQRSASDLPLCLFVFNVDTEEGDYLWLFEPVIGPDGRAELRLNDRLPEATNGSRNGAVARDLFHHLDNEAVDQIVAKVVRWHEASVDADLQAGRVR